VKMMQRAMTDAVYTNQTKKQTENMRSGRERGRQKKPSNNSSLIEGPGNGVQ